MNPSGVDSRRDLPSVDRLLGDEDVSRWVETRGRTRVARAVRGVLDEARDRATAGDPVPEHPILIERIRMRLAAEDRPSLRPVLNGTGVVLHTNLGRAPLSEAAIDAVRSIASGYSNLEYDLAEGGRGSRHEHCARLIRELTGSGGALVVNNNAAALVLAVNEYALGREVIVSRGELIEIGGSFRLPEMIERAGARLVEVGTTNRTRLADYEVALGPGTALLLKAHPSNYRMEGFVEQVRAEELAALGREHGLPLVYDLGSGLPLPEALPVLPPEPAPRDAIAAGADLVSWSGDKLLGGPQAGILHGSAAAIDRVRRNPLLRAFRVGKMTLAALEATLRAHGDSALAAADIPALRMLRESADSVEARAREALESAALESAALESAALESAALESAAVAVGGADGGAGVRIRVARFDSLVGGGAHPGLRIESAGWAVRDPSPNAIEERCRRADPPLLGRIEDGEFRVDCRTLLPGQVETAARILLEAMTAVASGSR